MRPSDGRFHEAYGGGGLLRTLPEAGIPRIEQGYSIQGALDVSVFIVQEPEKYELPPGLEGSSQVTIGSHEGQFWEEGDERGRAFWFYSGEVIEGQRIRVYVYTLQNNDLSDHEFKDFIASLRLLNGATGTSPLPSPEPP